MPRLVRDLEGMAVGTGQGRRKPTGRRADVLGMRTWWGGTREGSGLSKAEAGGEVGGSGGVTRTGPWQGVALG